VILIHGLFVDHQSWDLVMPELAETFRVIAPDLPGFGASEKPPPSRFPYGIEAFAEAIADLYAGLELGPAAVVGHALGGAVALTLAARHPELVSKLVLIDTLCYDSGTGRYGELALLPFVGGLIFYSCGGAASSDATFRRRCSAPPRAWQRHASTATTTLSTRRRPAAAPWPHCAPPWTRAEWWPKRRVSRRRRWSFGGAAIGSGPPASVNVCRGKSAALASNCWMPDIRLTKSDRRRSCASCNAS